MKTLLVSIIAVCISYTAYADMGPKPKREFELRYETDNNIKLIKGFMLKCWDEDCNDFDTLQELGPQRFECINQTNCHAVAYGFGPYSKLILHFDDKVRASDVFKAKGFNSKFIITVTNDGLKVKEVTPILQQNTLWANFLKSLSINLILELLVAFIFLRGVFARKSILKGVVYANLISLPIFWFVFVNFIHHTLIAIILGELFVFVFEGLFIYFYSKRELSLSRSLSLSLLANIISFFVGGLIIVLVTYLG